MPLALLVTIVVVAALNGLRDEVMPELRPVIAGVQAALMAFWALLLLVLLVAVLAG